MIINPSDVTFVVNNDDGTSTIGIRVQNPKTKKFKIESQIVTRKQGDLLALALEKRDKQNGVLYGQT